MEKFPRKLASDMYDNHVRFAHILHIPTLTTSSDDKISDEFQDFISSASEDVQSASLLKQCPELKGLLKIIQKSDDFEGDAHDIAMQLEKHCGDFEFLVQFETALPHGFKFNAQGEYSSNKTGGYYYLVWILAKDMVDAAEQANTYATDLFQTELEKAKSNLTVK